MYEAKLRKTGGSVMLTIPPALLDILNLRSDSGVILNIDGDKLIVRPKARPHYTLKELLRASDYSQPRSSEDREWLDAPAAGKELI